MIEVIFEPANPHDFSEEELQDAAVAIAGDVADTTVHIHVRKERGYGVTVEEVIHLWILGATAVTATGAAVAVLTNAVNWVRERSRNDRSSHPESKPRPRTLLLYDGTGKPLKRVRVSDPDQDPIEEIPDPDAESRPPP
jgi:hypothetical protein